MKVDRDGKLFDAPVCPAAQAVERERFEALLTGFGDLCAEPSNPDWKKDRRLIHAARSLVLDAYDRRAESRTAEQWAVAWRWCETKFGGEDWRYSETGPNPHRLCEPLYLASPTVAAATRAARDFLQEVMDSIDGRTVIPVARLDAMREFLADALPAEAPDEGRETTREEYADFVDPSQDYAQPAASERKTFVDALDAMMWAGSTEARLRARGDALIAFDAALAQATPQAPEDTKRLDWLQRQDAVHVEVCHSGSFSGANLCRKATVFIGNEQHRAGTIREAIDAALASKENAE